jgi:hypothetical protein
MVRRGSDSPVTILRMKAMRKLQITDETIVDVPALHLERVTFGSVKATLHANYKTDSVAIAIHESGGHLTVDRAWPY